MIDESREQPAHEESEFDLRRFRFECPECEGELSNCGDKCPHCGADLMNVFSATYRLRKGKMAKILAWAILVIFVGSMLWLFGNIVASLR
jgi:hypothetical protein